MLVAAVGATGQQHDVDLSRGQLVQVGLVEDVPERGDHARPCAEARLPGRGYRKIRDEPDRSHPQPTGGAATGRSPSGSAVVAAGLLGRAVHTDHHVMLDGRGRLSPCEKTPVREGHRHCFRPGTAYVDEQGHGQFFHQVPFLYTDSSL